MPCALASTTEEKQCRPLSVVHNVDMQRDSRFGFHPNVENLKTSSDEGRARAYCDPFEAFLYEARYLFFLCREFFRANAGSTGQPEHDLGNVYFFFVFFVIFFVVVVSVGFSCLSHFVLCTSGQNHVSCFTRHPSEQGIYTYR